MDCQFEKQQVSVIQLGLCGKFITIPPGLTPSMLPPKPQSYISVDIKRLFLVLDDNFLFLFFRSVENKNINYKIFVSQSFATPFKVLAVIAVDLHFEDCFSFVEYLTVHRGTTAVQFEVEG